MDTDLLLGAALVASTALNVYLASREDKTKEPPEEDDETSPDKSSTQSDGKQKEPDSDIK